jgi:hypothetical protein
LREIIRCDHCTGYINQILKSGHLPQNAQNQDLYPKTFYASENLRNPGYPHSKASSPILSSGSFSQTKKHKYANMRNSQNVISNLIPSYYLSCKGHSIKGLYIPHKAPFKAYIINTPIIAPPLIGDSMMGLGCGYISILCADLLYVTFLYWLHELTPSNRSQPPKCPKPGLYS